jgi:hypothetical protein
MVPVRQNSSNASIRIAQQSLTPSEMMLARELDLTAQNARVEISEALTREFRERYSTLSVKEIRWIFQTHRERSNYWPTIKEIEALSLEWRAIERRVRELQKQRNEIDETQRRLSAGERQFGVGDIFAAYKQLNAKKSLTSVAAGGAPGNRQVS